MPRTTAALELTDRYRFQQTEVRDKAMAIVARLWSQLDPSDLDGSFRRVLPVMVAAVSAAQRQNTLASPQYLAAFVTLEGGKGVPRPVDPPVGTDAGAPWELVLVSGIIETKVAIKQGQPLDVALKRGLARVWRVVATEVVSAGRRGLKQAMEAEPTVDTYRRVVFGTCGACLSQQGEESSVAHDLNIHPNCRCVTEPVVKPETDPKRVKQWQKQSNATLRKYLDRTDLHPLDRAEIQEALERKTAKKVAPKLAEPAQRSTAKEIVDAMPDAEKREALGEAMTDAIEEGKVEVADLAKVEDGNLVQRDLQDFLPSPDSPLTHEQYEALMPRGRWTYETRAKTRAALEQTREGRQLFRTLDTFQSGQAKNVPALRARVARRLAGEVESDAAADTLMGAIRHAPATDRTLYRGLRMQGYVEDILEQYTPGSTFDLNLSSFSSQRSVASRFAANPAGQKVRSKITNKVILEDVGEAKRALPIERVAAQQTFAMEKEWIAAGRYEVVSSSYSKASGTVVVKIRQIGLL